MRRKLASVVLGFLVVAACACAAHAQGTPAASSFQLARHVIPTCVAVSIDIKPGSEVNPINLKSNGVTPLVVFSSESFDATEIDPGTVLLAGASVAVRGNGKKYMAHEEDVDQDGLTDLVLKVETEEMIAEELEDGMATLTGNTFGDDCIEGEDHVTIVPPDIDDNHWAEEEVTACLDAEIVGGYEDDTYRPEDPVSRAQMAAFISRALASGDDGVPDGPPAASFPDVPADHWAYKYVEYVMEAGVVHGYPDGDYRPGLLLDRGQLAVFIARAMVGGDEGVPDASGSAAFPDVSRDLWCARYIEYCVRNEVVQGYDDGLYHPEAQVTRDQMAVYIARAFELPR